MKKVLFFLMIALFCLPWAAKAQVTLTVCDGTTPNSKIPVNSLYVDTQGTTSEFIIPADSLVDMAGGTITKLTFYVPVPPATWGSPIIQLYMGEVDYTTLTTLNGPTNFTVVATGVWDNTQTTIEVEFASPYTYEGGNLLIGTYVQTKSTTYKSTSFTGVSAESGASRANNGSGSGSANSFLPKTTFTYTPASTGCDMPTSITVNFISPTGAYVDWEGGGSAWNLRYKASTDDEWSLIEGLTTTNYTFDNTLVSNTTYSVGVQTVCTGSTSSFRSTSFTTPCSIVSIPTAGWTENFDDLTVESNYNAPPTRVLPDCWKAINNTTYSTYKQFPTAYSYTDYANSTPNCLKFYSYDYNNYYDAQPQYAILPMMSNLTGKQITLQAKGYNDVSTFKIGTMTDPTDPTTFTQISEQALTTSYQEFSYPLFGTNVYVAIMIDAADDDRYTNGVYIDDIEIGDIPSCAKPTAPEVTATGQTATFTWTSEVGNYQIAYANSDDVDLTDVDPADHIDGTATEATYTVEELALGDYYFWVRANCGTSGYSTWAGPASVHIGYCVPNPSSHDGSGITGVSFGTGDYVVTNGDGSASLPATSPFYGDYSSMTGAVQAGVESTIAITTGTNTYPYTFVIWVDLDNSLSFEDSEIFYIGKAPSGNGTFNATITIPATQAEGDYRMRIYGADSYFNNFYNNGTTNWEAAHDPCNSGTYRHAHDYTLRVLEAPSCLTPSAPTLSRNGNQITAAWEASASTYNIDINGTVTNNVTSPYVFTADLATTYTVKVQTNCGGETSDWSNTQSITTPDCWGGHTIDYTLIDQYDDSWNGASISVIGDCGAYNETLTVASGASPLSGTLNLCGDYYEFIWNKGSYDGECSFTFTEGGTTLFTKPSSVSDGLVLYTIGTQSCPKPTALENEDPEAHSVELSWTENGEATAWQLCVNGDEDNLIDVTENPYILENLTPGTDYSVKVRAKCSPADVSCWSNAVNFTTLPSCIDPTGLEVTANGVDATFTWESEVGSYEIARATTSDANPNEFVVGTADEESYTMNDLDLGDYYLWVRANCTQEDNSSWAGPVSLHIGYCMPANIKRDGKGITSVVFGTGENIVNNVDETNGLPSSSPYCGDYSSMVGAIQAGVESTIAITTSTGSFPYTFVVWVDFDNSLSFEDEEIVYTGKCASGSGTLNATINVPTTQSLGDYRMRIAGADSYFNDFYNNGNDLTKPHNPCNFSSTTYGVTHDYTLRVLEAPSCFAPTDLAVTYEGGTEATVSWTSEATAWNIDVNGTVTAITENPYTITGLALATDYAVKVQAVCDVVSSEWTNPVSFSTDLCMPENQCELTFELTDSYGDGWNGNKIEVTDMATGKVLGQLANTNANGGSGCNSGCAETETYTLAVCNGREIQFSWVSGSYPTETSYTVYDLNGNEIFSGSGAMSAPVNYTVNCASCAPVTDLEADVNGFDVTLTWEPVGSETDWAIRYREEGTADWNEDVNDGPEYEIAGLLPGDYEAEVRALCGSSVTSGWTSTTFTVECPNYSGEETVSICADSYEWNGETYTTSGDKQKHFTLANGCDSLATLHLTLKSPSYYTDVVNVCGTSYTWHGNIYYQSTNTPTYMTTNAVGCDSIVTLNLTLRKPTSYTEVVNVCGTSYTWHGTTYTNSITGPTYTTTNAAGCDSVVTLNLTLRKPTAYTEVVNVCGTSYTWHGTTYYNSINGPTYTTTNAAGCDSVITLNLTLRKPSTYTEVVNICGTSYTWHGTTYYNSINGPTYTTTNAAGCDSVVTLNLTLRKPSAYTEVVDICGTSYTWHGTTYTNSITGPTYTTTNAVGCDSVVTLNLTLRKPTSYTEVVNVCGTSYTWHGTTYYNSINGPTYTTTNAAGCDSVITLNLTLRKPSTYTEVVNICGTSYTWHGTTYTNSINGPTYTTTNAAGCDSVVTLNLTLRKPTTGIDKVEACNTFTWINGQTYNQSISGPTYTLTNAAGCDSVVTLNLTIYKSVTVELYDTVCEGNAYNNNGIYIRMLDIVEGDHDYTFDHQTTHQCDSTVVLHLHVDICDESCGQPIEDIDHNSYATMPVHRVCWMTSNLRTTRYADGTNIPFAIVYSYPYDPNNTDNLETFGRLYNWTSASKAVGTPLQGVCPDGWRLPTQAEFDELSLYFTESQLRSTDNWLQNPGTNESGFNKQPGGFYNGTTGKCERLGAAAHFYTADFQATGVTYQYSEYYCDGVLYDVTNNPQDGRSIRCVRDLVSQ